MGLPVIEFDYDILEEKLTLLILRDAQSGAKLAYDCEAKGSGDGRVVTQLVRYFEVWSITDILNVSRRAGNNRVAAGAGQGAAGLQNGDAQFAAIQPHSSGGVEKAAQDVVDMPDA